MAEQKTGPSRPDLTQGIPVADLVDGKLVGHVGEQDVLIDTRPLTGRHEMPVVPIRRKRNCVPCAQAFSDHFAHCS